jgi:REP element-mobilizing transposase RayT
MNITQTQHSRRSIRISEFEYHKEGAYFITICAYQKKCLFGSIHDEKMNLNNIGERIEINWQSIPDHFPNAELNEFVIMPNHMHGIISIVDGSHRTKTIGTIIGRFKSSVTSWVRANTQIHHLWQRNYYEHVIRDERDYQRIAAYIDGNPSQWNQDALHPLNDLQSPVLIENP